MTVYETIGATEDSLRSCLNGNCSNCLFKPHSTDCIHRLLSAALSVLHRQENRINHLKELSNSQQAEIERLQNECFCIANERDAIKDCIDTAVEEAKVEAIKEFVKKLKKEKYYGGNCMGYGTWAVELESIDNLVAEMKNKSSLEKENNNA